MSIDPEKRKSIMSLSDADKFSILEKIHKEKIRIDLDCFAMLLEDKNNGIREKAKNIILGSANPENISEMVHYLSSRNPETRNIIVEILYETADLNLDAVGSLTRSADEDLRIYACQILGHSKDPEAILLLKKMILDKSPNVRNAAAMAFESSPQRFDISFLIEALRKEKEEWVKFSIIEIIDSHGNRSFLKDLLELAEYEPDYIRLEILRLFKKFGDISSLRLLLEYEKLYTDTLFSDFNDCIITITNRSPDSESPGNNSRITDHMIRIAAGDGNPWNRYESIRLLSALRPEESLDLFKRFARDEHPLVRIASIGALAKSDFKEIKMFVKGFLEDKDDEVRKLAKKIYQDGR